jgi:hypothetical protein
MVMAICEECFYKGDKDEFEKIVIIVKNASAIMQCVQNAKQLIIHLQSQNKK